MTTTTPEERAEAQEILNNLTSDPYFMAPGQRNDHAVNLCIALRVLGLGNPIDWFRAYCRDNPEQFSPSQVSRIEEHLDRVTPYAESWGPIGNEGRALDYKLD